MKTYEYIFASAIMVAILIVVVLLTSITPQLYMSTSNVEQLKMVAQKVMARLLLSPGEPEDWGGDVSLSSSNLTSLGLAVSTVFTREAYVLDPDKVQRLSERLPGQLYIPPSKALELLGLGLDYGVKIELVPALNACAALSGSMIEVTATSEQGLPLANANVEATAFYVNDGRVMSSIGYGSTDFTGKCTINVSFSPPALVIVLVDYHGVQAINVAAVGDVESGLLIGRFLLTRVNGITEVYQVSVITFLNGTLGVSYTNCSTTLLNNYRIDEFLVYEMSHVEPNVIAVAALTTDGRLVVAWKDVPRSYGSLTRVIHLPAAYMLERSVKIGIFAYTLRITVWRMSW